MLLAIGRRLGEQPLRSTLRVAVIQVRLDREALGRVRTVRQFVPSMSDVPLVLGQLVATPIPVTYQAFAYPL